MKSETGAYSGVFPVAYDLLQVGGWIKEEVLSPFIPIHCHSAIRINATRQSDGERFSGATKSVMQDGLLRW